MKKLNLFLLALLTILASCSIEMNMTVNKDYSGSHEMVIDISQMMSFAASLDSLTSIYPRKVLFSFSLHGIKFSKVTFPKISRFIRKTYFLYGFEV